MNYEIVFGDLIRERRKRLHYSQEKLAEMSELSTQHISDIENGKTNPKLDTFIRLCSLVGIDTGDLRRIQT